MVFNHNQLWEDLLLTSSYYNAYFYSKLRQGTLYSNADPTTNYSIFCLRMSEKEEHDFIIDYLTKMKGLDLEKESLLVYNFGYDRPLTFPSIALTPDSTLRLNLQTAGMGTPSRRSIAVVGEKYLAKFEEIMLVVDKIHEDTQALPFVMFLQSENEIKLENMVSHHMHETPGLVGILKQSFSHRGYLS